jgi:hypothetical protein
MGKYVVKAFMLIASSGVLHEIVPEFFPEPANDEGPSRDLYLKRSHRAAMMMHSAPERAPVRLAALFTGATSPLEDIDPDCPSTKAWTNSTTLEKASGVLKRLKVSNEFFNEVLFLLSHRVPERSHEWSDAQVRVFISQIGIGRLRDVLDLALAERKAGQDLHGLKEVELLQHRIEIQLQGKHPFTLNDLPVNGRDVMEALAIVPGPQVGSILEDLLDQVHQDPSMNDRNILMDFLRKKVHKWA